MWERKGERETALSDERTKATTCGHRNTETPNFSAARIFARHTDTARHRNSNPQPPTSNAFAARLCRYFGSPASMAFVIDGRLQAAMEGDSAVEKLKRLVVEEGVSLTAVNNLTQAYQPMHLAVRTLACWLGLLAWLYSPTFRRVSRCRRLACWKGHADVCRILLNANANPLQQDNCSRSCLHLAAGSGLLDIVKALVACGAYINARTHTLDTPLLLAAWKGRYDVVSYLLELQADPTVSDNQQRNALHLAVRMLAISHPASASKPSSNRLESRSRTLAFEYRHGAGMQT